MMKNYLFKLIGVLVYGLVFGTYPAAASESPTAVTIEKSVHFNSPEGNDVLVEPGTYEVAGKEEELQLVSKEGLTPIHIHAQPTPFPDDVDLHIAMAIPIPGEGIYLALVIPDHPGLEAMGSYSGIQTRGLSLRNLRKTFSPPYRKSAKSFARALNKKTTIPSLKKEWNQLVKKGQQTVQHKGQLRPSANVHALMIEVLRQSYIESQKDLQFYRTKVRDANKKKQQIRQNLNNTKKKLANERDKQRIDQWQQMEQRLEQEKKKLDNASKDLNFKLQTAMSKFSQAQQAMAQVAKKSHDTQKKIIENLR
jgi:hypothetical protein